MMPERQAAAEAPRLADQWDRHWQDYEASARRNPAQHFRRRVVLAHLAHLSPTPLRVLDVGCGTGDFAVACRARFPAADILGLDQSETGLAVARASIPGGTFLVRDLLADEPPDPRFRGWATAAVCSEVLEHVDEPRLLLANLRPWLAPGAHLIVTVPGGPLSAYDRHLGHRRHFTRDALRALLADAGFAVDGVWGAGAPFFNLYRLVVLARGTRLIDDAARPPGLAGAATMRLFGLLLRLSRARSRSGWQIVGVARA
jgi:SAM-dependent methyltransferase